MIEAFLDSWDLFAATWLTGWLIAAVLAMTGVWVVAREQIFLGAAVGQASALGIALGLWFSSADALSSLLEHGSSEALLSAMAVAAAVVASLLAGMSLTLRRESAQAVTGWIFLVGMSGSMLLSAFSPYGTSRIQGLLTSTLIGATMTDVWLFAGLLAAAVLVLIFASRTVILLATSPDMAQASGIRTSWWNLLACIWLGVTIGLSMRVSGLLFTFGCLVLPAMICRQLCRQTGTIFIIAPLLAVAAAGTAFVLANHYDLPPAQVTVALLAALQVLAWAMGSLGIGRQHNVTISSSAPATPARFDRD